MLLNVQACYEATFKRKPARNVAAGYLRGVFPVAVAEVSEGDVRTVVRFGYRSAADPFARKWDARGPRREVRGVEYEGRLFFPFERDESTMEDAAWLASCCDNADGPFRNPSSGYRHTQMDTDDKLVVETSARREMAALLADRAARTLLIDGRIWHAANEPFLEVTIGIDDEQRYVVRGEVRFDEKGTDPSCCYRLDQRDLALARFTKGFEEAGQDLPDIDVLDAGVLHARFEERHLLGAAGKLLAALKKNALEEPVSYLVTFANLRDRVAEFQATLDADGTPDVDALVTAVEEAAALEFDDCLGTAGRALGATRRVELSRGDAAFVATMAF